MSLLQLVLVVDVLVLIGLTVVSALADARAARVRRRAAEADWALLRAWLDEAPTR